MTIKVFIADDYAMVRDGLCALLEKQPGFKVVGSAANGSEAVKMALDLKPDVILMDIAMPELNGIEATEKIKAALPETQVVILSVHATTEHIYRAFRAGALGYLLKESAGAEAIQAIQAAFEKRRYLTQRIADTVLDSYMLQRSVAKQVSPLESLSQREREVLELVVDGVTSAEIAKQLSLSPRTVETYRSRIMDKLDIHDLPALIRFAIENGITPTH